MVGAARRLPAKQAFLSEATRARIGRIYAKDFALLPYPLLSAAGQRR